ncbi:1-(5-phosphoribosyl)-5- ((5-phosphoribosylamino)methylideneamino)imidazole-4-carboxamide isomerase [Lupinus albus]|uniref:1-(5-phosphoribosyl)-5-((5-phosphoribosylamino)methylideneamino)imidazole-4-carboxamide isomerase n=1 Tax=Lupinus albus TaxID=3870 RepID=A0A6A4QEA5_LUPAL|nr:1-(5-phosphoribosyl)-5- ((5-phosphoribosylamino)methylideneamino)imidazole-4-carboxamide isomerase [Lupinus albus]
MVYGQITLPFDQFSYSVGKVKQIVGSTLQDLKGDESNPVTNFESDKSAAEYATLYKEDGLTGGHVIMLGADPLSKAATLEALHAYPGIIKAFLICFHFPPIVRGRGRLRKTIVETFMKNLDFNGLCVGMIFDRSHNIYKRFCIISDHMVLL